MKKKFPIILMIIIILVLGIGTYFLTSNLISQTGIGAGCTLSGKGDTYSIYECNMEDFICKVTPILECDTPSSQEKVMLRTNSPNWNKENFKNTGTWIVLDTDGDGGLEGYIRSSSVTNCMKDSSVNNFFKDKNIGIDFIYERNGDIFVCFSGSQAYKYEPTNLAITSISPTEPYKSNGQEKYSGDLYSCSKDVKINGFYDTTLSYSGDTPKTVRGEEYILDGNENEKIEFAGKIEFENWFCEEQITTCISSNGDELNIGQAVCIDDFTLEKCELKNQEPTLVTYQAKENQICEEGQLKEPYVVVVNIEKQVLSIGEKLNFDFELKETTDKKYKDVTATIIGTEISQTIQTDNWGKVSFSLDLPHSTGYYELKISLNHPKGNWEKIYNIQVTEGLIIVIHPENPIQFDNVLTEVRMEVYKGGILSDLVSYEIYAEFNNKRVYTSDVIHSSTGVYIPRFNLIGKGDGILRVKIRGKDYSGLWTEWTPFSEITIRKAKILFFTDFINDKVIGSYTNKFETRDSNNNLIETSNTVVIERPDGSTGTAMVMGSSGKYSFNYNFDIGGLYTIKITSTHPQLGSSQLNDGYGSVITILSVIPEGDNWTMYIIIGVFIVIVAVFVFILFKKKKK